MQDGRVTKAGLKGCDVSCLTLIVPGNTPLMGEKVAPSTDLLRSRLDLTDSHQDDGHHRDATPIYHPALHLKYRKEEQSISFVIEVI